MPRKTSSNGANELRDLAKSHAPAAFQKMLEHLDSQNERLSFAAAQDILNRAYGKAESVKDDNMATPTIIVVRDDRNEILKNTTPKAPKNSSPRRRPAIKMQEVNPTTPAVN